MEVSDQAIIKTILDGDQSAYEELVDRYKQALYRHCFTIVRDEDIAEDIAQDTFIAAYYALSTYNAQYRFATWLFKIATNKCLNDMRSRKRVVMLDEDATDRIVDERATPLTQAIEHEVRAAVDALRPKQRAVISLYYWQGLSIRDISQALGMRAGTVKVQLHRAKNDLRKELA